MREAVEGSAWTKCNVLVKREMKTIGKDTQKHWTPGNGGKAAVSAGGKMVRVKLSSEGGLAKNCRWK